MLRRRRNSGRSSWRPCFRYVCSRSTLKTQNPFKEPAPTASLFRRLPWLRMRSSACSSRARRLRRTSRYLRPLPCLQQHHRCHLPQLNFVTLSQVLRRTHVLNDCFLILPGQNNSSPFATINGCRIGAISVCTNNPLTRSNPSRPPHPPHAGTGTAPPRTSSADWQEVNTAWGYCAMLLTAAGAFPEQPFSTANPFKNTCYMF